MHYLVKDGNVKTYEPVVDTLIACLQGAGRLSSSNIFTFDVDRIALGSYSPGDAESERIGANINPALVRALRGCTVVITYAIAGEATRAGENAYQIFLRLIDVLRSSSNDIQTIFVLPERDVDLELLVRRRFKAPFVRLERDAHADLGAFDREGALRKLEAMACEAGMHADASLADLFDALIGAGEVQDLEGVLQQWLTERAVEGAYPQYKDVLEDLRKSRAEAAGATAMGQLDELVGLGPVKQTMKDIILRFRMNCEVRLAGLPVQPLSLHLAFCGAPGTGKTEVAQLYARILKEEGMLSEGRLVTVSGAAGWNVEDAFDAAKGSVLFIDEAYGMLRRPDNAVITLIALMEARRSQTVVILAGYEDEMDRLLDSNPGFRSRLGRKIDFPDYSTGELLQIMREMVGDSGLVFGPGTLERVERILREAAGMPNFGNARFARTLLENAAVAQASRLARGLDDGPGAPDRIALQTLLPEDFAWEAPSGKQPLGFGC